MAAAFAPPVGNLATLHRGALTTPAARRGVCLPPPAGRVALYQRSHLVVVAAAATPPSADGDEAATAGDDADGPSPVEAAKAAAAASAAADADAATAASGRTRFKYDPDSPTDAFGRDPKKETEAWMSGAREVLDSPEVRDAIEKHKAEPPPVTPEQQAYLDFIKSLDEKASGGDSSGGGDAAGENNDDPPPPAPES
ncbi:hypothetical protein MMPV_005906 [Pyropia vietnamensis]